MEKEKLKAAEAPQKVTLRKLNRDIKKATEVFNAPRKTTSEAVNAALELKASIEKMKQIRRQVFVESVLTSVIALIIIGSCIYGGYLLFFGGVLAALSFVISISLFFGFTVGIRYYVKILIDLFKN